MRLVTRFLALFAVIVAGLVLAGGVASAQSDGASDADAYVGGATTIPTNSVTPGVEGSSMVSPVASPEVKGSNLAFTGGDVLALVLVGSVAVGAGTVILTTRRRSALSS